MEYCIQIIPKQIIPLSDQFSPLKQSIIITQPNPPPMQSLHTSNPHSPTKPDPILALQTQIDVLRQVIVGEMNTIDGISIDEKSLPSRAFKAQLLQGRDQATKECPICNGEYNKNKKKKMVQCEFCTRACCDECCCKQRYDKQSKEKPMICTECDMLYLHWMLNDVYRRKEHVLNEALEFTNSGLKSTDSEIEAENERIRNEQRMKENPEVLKKVIRLSNLKKEIVKEEGIIKKMRDEESQNSESLEELRREYEAKKGEYEVRKEEERRERDRVAEEEKRRREKEEREVIRREEEEKLRVEFERQKEALVKEEFLRQEKEREKKLLEEKERTQRELQIQELSEEEKMEKLRELELFRAKEQKEELERLKREVELEAERREREKRKEEEQNEQIRQRLDALERDNQRLNAEVREAERRKQEEIEQEIERKRMEEERRLQEEQQAEAKRKRERELEQERQRRIQREQQRQREQQLKQREDTRIRQQQERKQREESERKEEERKTAEEEERRKEKESISEHNKEQNLRTSVVDVKRLSEMQMLKAKVPLRASVTLNAPPKPNYASRMSNPSPIGMPQEPALSSSGLEPSKQLTKEEIFNRKPKKTTTPGGGDQIDEKPKCACLLF